jgi:hypothetical protein
MAVAFEKSPSALVTHVIPMGGRQISDIDTPKVVCTAVLFGRRSQDELSVDL